MHDEVVKTYEVYEKLQRLKEMYGGVFKTEPPTLKVMEEKHPEGQSPETGKNDTKPYPGGGTTEPLELILKAKEPTFPTLSGEGLNEKQIYILKLLMTKQIGTGTQRGSITRILGTLGYRVEVGTTKTLERKLWND